MDETVETNASHSIGAAVPAEPAVAWRPLTARQRRVLGTLMEKSKTTPDAYPMTFAGLTTGANQKSNRAPISNYSSEQIETTVDELRTFGAVTIIQGSGRVTKVRHYAYNWLGLSKVEAAIMTELLLRGEQTVGELRTRASRMEPIADLDELKRLLDELKRRNLIVELSPAGRGQVLSHNLYPDWELEQLQKNVAAGIAAGATSSDDELSATPASSPKSQVADRMSELAVQLGELKQLMDHISVRVTRIEKELGL